MQSAALLLPPIGDLLNAPGAVGVDLTQRPQRAALGSESPPMHEEESFDRGGPWVVGW